ncbi:unnamed protein product [Meloidogyne enterolobii]|uniref:Uncharacterized protein n=1 Tax=Meloidogyne enterolobii TaxID=390850 RepID=A0ACB1AI09_MELEN
MTHGMLTIIQVAETPGGYRDQADTFGLHTPTQLIKEEKSPRTEILKALYFLCACIMLVGYETDLPGN